MNCPRPPRRALDLPPGRYGNVVSVTGFAEAWQTGYVTMRGLPDIVCCGVPEFKTYCKTLHDLLTKAYADLGIEVPRWRSWDSYAAKWPCLASDPKRRVHVLKPLE